MHYDEARTQAVLESPTNDSPLSRIRIVRVVCFLQPEIVHDAVLCVVVALRNTA